MNLYKKRSLRGVLMVLLAAPLSGALVADVAAPRPQAMVFEEISGLELSGSGDFDFWFWDIYVAALWAPQGKYSRRQPHALTLRYERDFQGRDIADRSIQEIRDLELGSPEEQADWLMEMTGLFPDVATGDTLTGVHFPGDKAVFYRNDQRIGVIEDPAFARAFFAIWLDQRTNAPKLRGRLLGETGSGLASSDSR